MIQNKYIVRLAFIGLFINIIVNMIYYRYFIIEEMILKQVGEANIKIADIYTNNVWNRSKIAVDKLHKFGYKDLLQDMDFIKFATTSVDIFVNLNSYISLYDIDGNKIITSTPIQVVSYTNFPEDSLYKKITTKIDRYFLKELTIDQAFNKAFKGITSHVLIPNAILHFSGKKEKSSCITSYIPIINHDSPHYPVEGVLEINTNITALWSGITELEKKVFLIFIIILVIFLIIIMSNTNYAQKIIDQQFETNKILKEAVIKVQNESSAHTKFFANVSHELRTPLNAIIGFSEIMMSTPYNKEHDNYVKDINNAGKHLLSIITDILDLSKASADKLTVDCVELDINKLITSTIRLMQPKADETSIQLITKLPKDHILIKADPKRLKQVFFNLLSNSIKFTNSPGSITIHAEKNESQGLVYIKVIDTGIGINEKDIPRALSAFAQVDSTISRKHQGSGLGLPLTKKLVELMQGKFDLQSKVGIGTTITLTFAYDSSIEL